MALGSSAPEILLSVIELISTLGSTPGELGPSTIVGSAAFNLLVISGVSIAAVGKQPKKIADLGVFAVTCTSSFWAYIWMLIVLEVWTPQHVTIPEAVLTLIFFVLLIVLAFAADKYNEKKLKRLETKEEAIKKIKKQKQLAAKDELQRMEQQGQSKAYLLELVYGAQNITRDQKAAKIVQLFKEALDVEDLSKLELVELNQVFEPDNEIQQIRYKRAFGKILGAKRDFVIMKGQVGQAEHILENQD